MNHLFLVGFLVKLSPDIGLVLGKGIYSLSKHRLNSFDGQNYPATYEKHRLEIQHKKDGCCLLKGEYVCQLNRLILKKVEFKLNDLDKLALFSQILANKSVKRNFNQNKDRER